MIAFTEVPDTNIVELAIDGDIAKEEFERVVPKFVEAAEKNASLRLLKQIRDVDSIDPASFGLQLGDVFSHLGDITHAAIVADTKWETAAIFMGTAYPFEMKFFGPDELESARDWLYAAE